MTITVENQTNTNHVALYRKYRPAGFESLVGQDHIKVTIENAIKHNKVSHAYLFTGPRGTGKTSLAKLFAKALNCKNPIDHNPCGKCDCCLESAQDIIEMDAASNNGVEDIRQLRENIAYTPMQGKYKIYILDEVHMLSTAAFNALLKTLEEPPSHAIFILATTEVHKLPPTILSRCQRFDFRRITQYDIVERLKFVVQNEGKNVDENALQLIAQVSAGGLRDALSLLDQAIAHSDASNNSVVTLESVLALTGAVDVRVIGKLLTHIGACQIEASLEHFNLCFDSGKEPKFFIEEMLIYLRDILVFKKLGTAATLKKGQTDENFAHVAALLDTTKIYSYLDILQETLHSAKYHHDLQLLLEMTIIKLCQNKQPLQEQIDELRSIIKNGVSANIYTENNIPVAEQLPMENSIPAFEEQPMENNVPAFEEQPMPNNVPAFEEQTIENNVPTFEEQNMTNNVPVYEQTPLDSDVPPLEEQGHNIDDPIGFINTARAEHEAGVDWADKFPSETQNNQHNKEVPSQNSMPVNNETFSDEDISNINTNVLLSEREKNGIGYFKYC